MVNCHLTQAFSFVGHLSLKSSHSLISWTSHLDSRLFWYLGNQTLPLSLAVSSLFQNPDGSYPNLVAVSHKHLAGLHCEFPLSFRGVTGANSRPASQGLTVYHHPCSFSPHDTDAHGDLKNQSEEVWSSCKVRGESLTRHTFGFDRSKKSATVEILWFVTADGINSTNSLHSFGSL